MTPLLEQDGVTVKAGQALVAGRLTLVVPTGAPRLSRRQRRRVRAACGSRRDQQGAQHTLQDPEGHERFISAPPRGREGRRRRERGPLVVREDDIGVRRQETTAGFQRSVPSYLVMFVFLNLLVSGAGIAEDRASGRLRRMAMAPVSRRAIVLGKLLGRFAIGWIQIVYMLASDSSWGYGGPITRGFSLPS